MGINILILIGGIMKDAVIFYFSGTGNTWWISNRIAKALEAKEISASTVSIEKSLFHKLILFLDLKKCYYQ
jgi:flavodoxin